MPESAVVLISMGADCLDDVLPPRLRQRLSSSAEIAPVITTDLLGAEVRPWLARAAVLLTSWGAPRLDAEVLAHASRLRAVCHAAGSVKCLVSEALWDRGIQVSSAVAANAIPVAEFTVAAIVLGRKRTFWYAAQFARTHDWRDDTGMPPVGTYGLTVGVVGASRIGRLVIARLRDLGVRVLVADPFLTAEQARELGAELVELDEMFRTCEVVTLHAPALPQTRHLADARRLAMLPDGALLVNTARGSLVDTAALTAELVSGRLDAVLDVTDPEPLPADSPLYGLPNVLLTPHIAGALGAERARLGELAVAEVERVLAGQPLAHEVRQADLAHIA